MRLITHIRPIVVCLVLLPFAGALAPVVVRADTMSATTILRATVQASTSLRVSGAQVEFETPTGPAASGSNVVGSVEFAAGARTHGGGDVILTVEPLTGLECAGADQTPAAIRFRGVGSGMTGGVLSVGAPQVAGRWTGSGRRDGRVEFLLEGAAAPGPHTIPLRFVLSAP